MSNTNLSAGAEIGKKIMRFGVSIVGLLLLRGLLSALPMLRNASVIGSTFLSPRVLANATVDSLILIVLVSFGYSMRCVLRDFYPRIPDLSTAAFLAVVLLALVMAYNLYELPIACTAISPQDLFSSQAGGGARPITEFFGQQAQTVIEGIAGRMSAEVVKNSSGATLEAFQKAAVTLFRQSPDLYGWIFLILSAVPVVGLVVLGARNLDGISEQMFHTAQGTVRKSPNSPPAGGSQMFGRSNGMSEARATKQLSSDDIDKLARLKSLLDAGVITQIEFETQKKGILGEAATVEEPAELQRLKQLRDLGALTEKEYETQRQRFLQ